MLEQLSFFGQESIDLEKKKKDEEKKKVEDKKKTHPEKNVKVKQSKTETKTKKKKENENFQLPLTVHGGIYTYTIDGEGEISKGNIKKCVSEKFPEIKDVFSIKKQDEDCILETNFQAIDMKKMKDEIISCIKYGDLIEVSVTEGTLKEAWKSFLLNHQEFFGAKCYLTDDKMLVPFFDKQPEVKQMYQTPVRIGFCKDQVEEISFDKEYVSERELIEEYSKNHPEFKDGSFLNFDKYDFFMPISTKFQATDTTKLKLPITVRTGAYDIEFDITDFDEELVTLEQIRKALENEYPEYSKERTEMIYDNRHFVVAVLKSSKKGYKIIPNKQKNVDILENEDVYAEKYPYGSYFLFKNNCDVDFEINEMIPYEFFQQILELFQDDPLKEKAAQIFWNGENYELYVPEQVTSETSVEFIRNENLEMEKLLVMDVHSHGIYPAFFSEIDNQDEKGTRIYMVLGTMNERDITMKIRAGVKGHFHELDFWDVFSCKREDIPFLELEE